MNSVFLYDLEVEYLVSKIHLLYTQIIEVESFDQKLQISLRI